MPMRWIKKLRGIKNKKSGLVWLMCLFGVSYPLVGIALICQSITPDYKISDLTELALGLALLFFGITVLFFAESMRKTANFYFDDKRGPLMDYDQKIYKINSKNSPDDLEYVLDRVECDLRALSNWKQWALLEKQKDLINNYVIKIIKNAYSKDTCNNNRKKICNIIDICLEFDNKSKRLKNLKNQNPSEEQNRKA
jgi:uncharacterized protein YaaR (DUF327 family)